MLGEGDTTLGQGCRVRRRDGELDLGLVNTDESVWKLWGEGPPADALMFML